VARFDAIKGVGLLTAAMVVTELWGLGPTVTPKQAVAYAGLDPAPHQSGGSVRGGGQISKAGNARLRQALYMAALSASQHNPPLRRFYQRLLARGKPKPLALVAVARKLLVLMVTLLRHNRTYDPDWATHRPRRS
jgi:transposase